MLGGRRQTWNFSSETGLPAISLLTSCKIHTGCSIVDLHHFDCPGLEFVASTLFIKPLRFGKEPVQEEEPGTFSKQGWPSQVAKPLCYPDAQLSPRPCSNGFLFVSAPDHEHFSLGVRGCVATGSSVDPCSRLSRQALCCPGPNALCAHQQPSSDAYAGAASDAAPAPGPFAGRFFALQGIERTGLSHTCSSLVGFAFAGSSPIPLGFERSDAAPFSPSLRRTRSCPPSRTSVSLTA